MIEKIILNPDEDKKPAVIQWDRELEDYVIDTPDGLSRMDLIAFVDEVKRLTQWEE